MNKITILGTGTANIVVGQCATGILIQRNGKNYVYDFGRGIATQLVKLGLKQDDVKTVILSHCHPDHVSDLIPYLQAASWSKIDKRTQPLTVYGGTGVPELVSGIIETFGKIHVANGFEVITKELSVGSTTIDGNDFTFNDLDHNFGTDRPLGMTFIENGKKYAIMSDSILCDELVTALKDVDFGIFDAGHIKVEDIIELAVRTQAKVLVCSHQYYELDEAALNNSAKEKGYTGQLIVAKDLMEFEI